MRKYLLSVLLAVIFFIGNLFILSDYGINWDSPLHMLRGQAYADIFLRSKPQFSKEYQTSPNVIFPFTYASRYYFAASETGDLILPKVTLPERHLPQKEYDKDLSFYRHPDYTGESFKAADAGHLPLVAVLSAFSNRIFWGNFGWLGDIESYQLIYLFFSALGVFIVSAFVFDITHSYLASIIGGLSLALFPMFFAEAHINSKDPIQASLFAGAVWSFWRWVRMGPPAGGLKWFGMFMAFVALALAVKWNIVFLSLILLPWLILIRKSEEFKKWFKLRKLVLLSLLFLLFTFSFLILIWPYAWNNPIQASINTFNFYLKQGIGTALIQPPGFILPGGFNIYPLILFLTQTPEIILILGGIGIIGIIRNKFKTSYLLLLWLLISLLRLSFPEARTYGGLRQIMEVLPVMAILAGVGAGYLVRVISDKYSKGNKFLAPILLLVTCYLLLLPIRQLHPNQNAYFNSLAGGLKGAKEKGLIDWTLTYGNIYKQGALWLNENAQMNSNIAHLSGADFALAPLWLREDISISPYHFSGFDQEGEYILSLYNPLEVPVFAKRYPERFLNPVHTVEVDGVALLFIYKNEPQYARLDLKKEEEIKVVKMVPQSSKAADFWRIDLGKQYQVTRIVVNGVDSKCAEGVEQKEAIAFDVDLTRAYVLNEKKVRQLAPSQTWLADGESRVEYLFAAEPARFIYIYPQNNESCFSQEKVLSINYLSN
ncbi:MAG: hypothetical protein Q8P92_00685 [Candidatus Daviesbacteria bacterium]|nr:hypothetical protein [Candidatus Daviesbacteria bacterium]